MAICSGCITEFNDNDMYTVSRLTREGSSKNGLFRLAYCKKCIKNKDSYIDITEKPKNG